MADDVTVTSGSYDATVGADVIGGVAYQRTKLVWGTDGTATDASASDPLPTVQTGALPAGTNAIGKLAANSGVDIGDVDVTSVAGNVTVVQATASNLNAQVVGAVAHDGNTAVNPVQIGLRAETSLKGVTLVADADVTHAYGDADGVLVAKLNTTGADLISEAVSNTDGSSTAFSNFTAVASTYNYITAISVFRTDTATTMAYVDFRDGTSGSVKYRMPLPPMGGSVLSASTPLFKTSANTALAYDVSAALTTVYISVTGFQSKV